MPWQRYGSSPHTRGARVQRLQGRRPQGIIPAYAGSTYCWEDPADTDRDHPRIRGEHQMHLVAPVRRVGSSPHTRGAPLTVEAFGSPGRIIPAYAGSTSGAPTLFSPLDGSSPHTRGAHPAEQALFLAERIIPAYAGSTRGFLGVLPGIPDHPRIRGEHRLPAGKLRRRMGSSPHTRGAPSPGRWGCCETRIIPAYAGSTAPSG